MSKKVLQIYEIGKEMPEEDKSVTIDLKRHPFKSRIVDDIPHGLTKVQLEIWRLQNQKK